ncbi:MAG: cell wall hydrolase [Asticcacaulis sp.]
MRLFLAAGSAGLMIGAAAGSAWLGGHMARQSQSQYQAANLFTRDDAQQSAHLLDVKNPKGAQNRGALKRIKQAGFGDADLDRRALSLVMRYDSYASPVETLRLREQEQPNAQLASVRQNKLGHDGAPIVQASMGMGILNESPFGKSRPAAPFVLKNKSHSDLDCLTQAVYYEARGEGESGQRAVAQVILNRVRHPAYPKTICNVVYQGAERRTGCQFSFTCSGVMGRRVESGAWKRAHAVASAALNGYVAKSVGSSTHFHTLEVRPVWRHRMDHIATVGNHAFYQFPGKGARMVASADEIRPSSQPVAAKAPAAPAAEAAEATDLMVALERQAGQMREAERSADARAVKLSAPVKGAEARAVVSGVSAKPSDADAAHGS